MGLKGRFFSERDINLINSFSAELMGDIIQTEVTIFKACADATSTNIYGESKPSVGKQYYPGIEITAMIDRGETATDVDDFGTDRKQNVVFKFREKMLKVVNLFPQTGDLVLFNERYHEIDDISQEQFLGGIDDKSYSIICNTHFTRLSKVDVVVRQS
jgi:hypothetical protein